MRRSLPPPDGLFLEGLCAPPPGAVRKHGEITVGAGGDGVERIEARFAEKAFSPHRHDSYAIGVTLAGVQSFRYRGEQRHCLPGQCLILHPDELHDGEPGTEDGFRYRIIYIDPALVQQALDGSPLPFVADPVLRTPGIGQALLADALDMADAVDELRRIDIGTALARLLRTASGAASGAGRTGTGLLDLPALLRVREQIAADPAARHSAAALERLSGLDRWTLARQFRAAFGTSPSRFRTMRQLDRARRLMVAGTPLAEAALEAGFADQSHLSRQFKRAYGMTPARWRAALEQKVA